MGRFEIAILFLVIGLVIGWIVGYFFDSQPAENDMPHFIPPDHDHTEND
jgi:uncharacterized protein YneF (UPF0154 family)